MLLLSGRSPNKILFAKDSGRLFQLDMMPLYGDKGSVERIEVVPYRLTRNLATFFTAFGVEVSNANYMEHCALGLESFACFISPSTYC
jgi:transformation/transcription domain-associated protein